MTQETKVFVSHHHSDKVLLARVKAWLKHYGICLFLAHDDIEVGKIDYDAIREGIVNSDAFFAYGSKAAMESPACNQEIGMAMALGEKPTIWAITPPNRPWGIMTPLQSIIIKSGDEDEVAGALFYDLLMTIENIIRPDSAKEQKDAMNEASINAFALWHNRDKYSSNPGIITICPVEYGYGQDPHLFYLYHAEAELGFARIACIGQSEGQSTKKFLPLKFPFLGDSYRSKIDFKDSCNPQFRRILSLLLNDINSNTEMAKNFKDEYALKNILLYDYVYEDMEDIPFD